MFVGFVVCSGRVVLLEGKQGFVWLPQQKDIDTINYYN